MYESQDFLIIVFVASLPILMRISWLLRTYAFDGVIPYAKEIVNKSVLTQGMSRKDLINGIILTVMISSLPAYVIVSELLHGAHGMLIVFNILAWALVILWVISYIFIIYADSPSKITRESAIFVYGAIFALMTHHVFHPFFENEFLFYTFWIITTLIVSIAAISIYKDSISKVECKLCKIHRYFWRFVLVLVAFYVLMFSLEYEMYKSMIMAVYATSIVLLRIADLKKPMQVVKTKEKYSGVTCKVLNVVLFIVGMIITFVAIHCGYIVEMLFGAFIFADIIPLFLKPKEWEVS